jgi:hypothetical protein
MPRAAGEPAELCAASDPFHGLRASYVPNSDHDRGQDRDVAVRGRAMAGGKPGRARLPNGDDRVCVAYRRSALGHPSDASTSPEHSSRNREGRLFHRADFSKRRALPVQIHDRRPRRAPEVLAHGPPPEIAGSADPLILAKNNSSAATPQQPRFPSVSAGPDRSTMRHKSRNRSGDATVLVPLYAALSRISRQGDFALLTPEALSSGPT